MHEISKYLIEKVINIYNKYDYIQKIVLYYLKGKLRHLLEYDPTFWDIYNINPSFISQSILIKDKDSKIIISEYSGSLTLRFLPPINCNTHWLKV